MHVRVGFVRLCGVFLTTVSSEEDEEDIFYVPCISNITLYI